MKFVGTKLKNEQKKSEPSVTVKRTTTMVTKTDF